MIKCLTMNKKAIEENLTFLRLILATAFAFLAGAVAYLVNNLTIKPLFLLYFDEFLIIILIAVIIYTTSEIKLNINKLED